MKSKIRIMLLTLIVGFCVLVSGCSNIFTMLFEPVQNNKAGTAFLTVELTDNAKISSSRVIMPLTNGLTYTVSLQKGSEDANPVIKKDLKPSDKAAFDALEIGAEYTVNASGAAADGAAVLTGNGKFTAKEGANTVVIQVGLVRGSGTGNLYVEYKIPQDIGFSMTSPRLIPLLGGESVAFTETEAHYDSVKGLYIVNKKGISAGTYILSLPYSISGVTKYLPVDPLVEIFSGLTSSMTGPVEVSVESQVQGKMFFAANSMTLGSTGLTPDDPVTLDHALFLINADTTVTEENPALVIITENITLQESLNYIITKPVLMYTSGSPDPYSIEFQGTRNFVFMAGLDEEEAPLYGGVPITGSLTLSHIVIQPKEGSYAVRGLLNAVNGSITLAGGVVLQNNTILAYTSSYSRGGAVFVKSTGSLITNGAVINNCSASEGGAFYIEGNENPEILSEVTLIDTTVTNCKAGYGGAVYSSQRIAEAESFTTVSCTARNDSTVEAGGFGGALYMNGGSFNFISGSVQNCTAATTKESIVHGGGIYVGGNGVLNLSTGSVTFSGNVQQNIFIENYSLDSIRLNYAPITTFLDFKETIDQCTGGTFVPVDYNECLFSGKGTEAVPYVINNAEDFNGIRYIQTTGRYFIQSDDLDFTGLSPFVPWDFFSGIYNGNNRRIINFTGGSAGGRYGLFYTLNNAQVSGIYLENVSITLDDWAVYAGSLAAVCQNNSTITNCGATGNFTGTGYTDTYCGGLVGQLVDSQILSSFSSVVISTSDAGTAGGLVGRVSDTTGNYSSIQNCYTSMSSLTGLNQTGNYLGTLVGSVDSSQPITVSNSYSTAYPQGTLNTRNFIAYSGPPPSQTYTFASYYNASGYSAAASDITLENMTKPVTYTPSGFTSAPWIILNDSNTFPSLNWHASLYMPEYFRVMSVEYNEKMGGTPGVIEAGDFIVIYFSHPVEPKSIKESLTAGGTISTSSSLSLSATTSSMTFTGSVTIGSFALTGSVCTIEGSVDVNTITLSTDAKQLTLTLGTVSSLSFINTELNTNNFITFTPSTNIRSAMHNQIFSTPVATNSGILF